VIYLERSTGRTDVDEWYDTLSPITDDQIVSALTTAGR
jgi:hypothetical protein